MAKLRKRVNKAGVSWQIDYYDPEGKRKMKCFALKKDAEAYLGKVTAAKKEGRYHDVFDVKKESQTIFNELARLYVENFGFQRAFNTSKRYLLAVVQDHFGDRRLSEITYLDLETYRNRRKATPANGSKQRTDASVNREMALISHMLSKAVEWGMLETSPFKKGKRLMFKENNHRLRFLTEAEVAALLTASDDLKAHSPYLRPLVETALLTGMRRGELLALKWEQIRNGFIYLEAGMVKSGKGRQIPINDRLAEVFKEVRRGNQLKSEFVFCDSQGRRFYAVKRSFASACRRAGVEDFRFHDLRHTFASRLVMRGASLKAVQELLGHADMKMTMRYAHLSHEHLRDSVNLLNDLPSGKELVNKPQKSQKASNPKVANLL
ncbi:MAG: site-specific integrase [Desulfobacterales bacterium]|nr:site-specific integrase [Pseudomonadota bacterium]MBU4357223.1 site-specific integrase [Pseudomonadota bacterium]MCG2773545.1 site-specific integrase [Desulfobacterales bacterium]